MKATVIYLKIIYGNKTGSSQIGKTLMNKTP